MKMIVNGVGAVITGVVALIFAITKFTSGAWVVLIVIPALVLAFYAIHRHYRTLAGSSRSSISARRPGWTGTAWCWR